MQEFKKLQPMIRCCFQTQQHIKQQPFAQSDREMMKSSGQHQGRPQMRIDTKWRGILEFGKLLGYHYILKSEMVIGRRKHNQLLISQGIQQGGRYNWNMKMSNIERIQFEKTSSVSYINCLNNAHRQQNWSEWHERPNTSLQGQIDNFQMANCSELENFWQPEAIDKWAPEEEEALTIIETLQY